MRSGRRASALGAKPALPSRLNEALPFLIGSVALFLAGLVTWIAGFGAAFSWLPLWSLFTIAGAVALVGAGISWFIGMGRSSSPPPTSGHGDRVPRPEPIPQARQVTSSGESRPSSRAAVTHPPPLVPWSKGGAEDEMPTDRETNGVLAEIDNIQDELTPRRLRGHDRSE
jgi:hypothetical protein